MVKSRNHRNNLDCYIIILSMTFLITDTALNNNFSKLTEKIEKSTTFFTMKN